MLYFCKNSTKCLFCKANCKAQQIETKRGDNVVTEENEATPTATSLSNDNSEDTRRGTKYAEEEDCSCHKFPVQFLGSSVNQLEKTKAFHENLKYVFLLREMLDYPKRKCLKYLKDKQAESLSSGNTDAFSGWFSVCDNCTKIVEEGHLIYHEIEKLNLKLEGLKNNLSELLIESQNEEEIENADKADDDQEDDEEETSIFTEVREHFIPRKRSCSQPVIDGPVVKMEVEASLPLELDDADPQLDDLLGDENFDDGSDWAPSEEDMDVGLDAVDEDNGDMDDPLDIKPNIEQLDAQRDQNAKDQEKSSVMSQIATGVMEKKLSKMKPAPKSRKMLRLTRSSIKQQEETFDSEDEMAEGDADDSIVEAEEKRKDLKRKKSKSILSDSESGSMSESEKSDESDNAGDSSSRFKFPCKLCGAVYYTKHRLKEHQNLHSSDDAFKCHLCPFVSVTNRGLRMHTTKIHKKVSRKYVGREKKKRIASNPEPNEDSSSSSPFKTSMVKSNTSALEISESGDLTCSYCPVTYQTTHRLKEHEEHHHRDDVIKCGQCNYVCILERGMKIHVSKYHNRKEYKRLSVKEKKAGSDEEEKGEEEYKCKLCGATYKSPHRIREHQQLHVSKHAIRCPESDCLFVCKTNRGLIVHMNAQHNKGPVKYQKRNRKEKKSKPKIFKGEPRHCKLCPAKYHTRKRFSQHVSLHSKAINFPCDECGWVFSEEGKRDYHYKLSHTKRQWCRKTYQCIYCEIAPFEYRFKYMEHLRLNHQSKIVQCTNCDEPCESQEAFNVHFEKCTRKHEEYYEGEESDEKPYSCPKCETTFSQKENLKKHMDKKHSSEEFPCEHCPSVFPTEGRLRYHLARQHDKIQNVCKICNYKAHGASHLRLHMQKHTKERLFACEMCGKTFVSPTYLTAHKQKEHYEELGMDPIKCDQCDLLLPTKSILKYHIQKVHEKKFKFFCEICGKGFLFASGLKNHAAAHSTERNEICKFCGAAYVYNRVLQEHMKNHHPEEYAALKGIDRKSVKTTLNINTQGPFICKLCNEEFPFRWGLHNHMKTHTEVYDRYKCGICGKGYSSPAGVKRHEETAHVANSFSCQDCGKTFPCRDYLRYHMKNHCHKKEEQSSSNSKSEQASTSDSSRVRRSDIKHDPHIVKEAGHLHIVTPSAAASSSSAMHVPHTMSNFQYSQIQPGSEASSSSSYVATPTQHPHIQQPENLGDPEAVSSFYRSFFSQHGLPNK